ncbi:hypothetical protein LMG33818_001665 [Halomonadaceae bacterium LMG 33818]
MLRLWPITAPLSAQGHLRTKTGQPHLVTTHKLPAKMVLHSVKGHLPKAKDRPLAIMLTPQATVLLLARIQQLPVQGVPLSVAVQT